MKDGEYPLAGVIVSQTHELLRSAGYKLIDDAWKKHGRYTFLHDEDAARDYMRSLNQILQMKGWVMAGDKLRTFRHPHTLHEIEIEPGGAEVTGHFLHYMNARV